MNGMSVEPSMRVCVFLKTGLTQRILVSTLLTLLMSFTSVFMTFDAAALGLSLAIYGSQFQNNTFIMVAFEISHTLFTEHSRQARP